MGKKCVAWVLALVLALCGCSAGGGNSVPAGESSHSSAVEAAAQPTASPAPEPAPATVEGKVARASKSAFELRLEDGSALTVVITDETQVTGDALLDGCQAARAIRALDRPDSKTVPILALTANAFAEDIAASAQAGMNAHIAKPIQMEQLAALLEQLTGA